MLTQIKSNFNRNAWILIGIAIVVDSLLEVAPTIVYPAVGLFLVSALCGPWAGGLTGLLTSLLISTVFLDKADLWKSPFFPWWLISLFMGFFAGQMAQWGYFKSWWKSILTGFLTAVATTALYIAIDQFFFTTTLGIPQSFLGRFISGPSNFLGTFLSTAVMGFNSMDTPFSPISTALTTLMIFFLVKSPLSKLFIGLPHVDYVQSESSTTNTQKVVGLIAIAVLILWIILVIFVILAFTK